MVFVSMQVLLMIVLYGGVFDIGVQVEFIFSFKWVRGAGCGRSCTCLVFYAKEVVESFVFCCNILGFKFELFGHLVIVCLERLRSSMCPFKDFWSLQICNWICIYVFNDEG